MKNKVLFAQVFNFQKAVFDSTFTLIKASQDQSGIIMNKTLETTPWFPEDSKKTCLYLTESLRENSKQFKELVDTCFNRVESCLSVSQPSKTPATTSKAVKKTTTVKKETPNTKSAPTESTAAAEAKISQADTLRVKNSSPAKS